MLSATNPGRSESRRVLTPEVVTNRKTHERVERLEALANVMEGAFKIPGTKIDVGWDAILGLIPGVGDLLAAGVSLWIIREARQLGVSRWVLARMVWNVAVDVGVGAVPVVGDAFDVAWKANRMNVRLLKRHLAKHPPK